MRGRSTIPQIWREYNYHTVEFVVTDKSITSLLIMFKGKYNVYELRKNILHCSMECS